MSIPSVLTGLSFVPVDVLRVMEKIHGAGFEVWIVGGALRDHLLGLVPKDWDLATSAGSEQIMKIFPKVIPIGIRHGTVQVHTRNRDIEVTSFDSTEGRGILQDLGRRDFTINAMALSYPDGILIDPHNGRDDLKSCLLRGVLDPRSRFAEDPLRIVRAARLSGIYCFNVDPETFEAMRLNAEYLEKMSGERIRDELCKILLSRHPIEAFDLLRKSWALGKLLPELVVRSHVKILPGSGTSVYMHALLCVRNCPLQLRIRLAALFQNAAVPADSVRNGKLPFHFREQSAAAAATRMKKWNMSNRQIEEVSHLIRNQLPPGAETWTDLEFRRYIARVGSDFLDDVAVLAEAERTARGLANLDSMRVIRSRIQEQEGIISAMRVHDLAIDGGEVMKVLGLKPGPQIGGVLKYLFEKVLESPDLNTREHLLEILANDFPRT